MKFAKLLLGVALSVLGAQASQAADPAPKVEKVFRYSFRSAETGFDGAQINDLYSRTITDNIFESLYKYDYLSKPIQIVPALADGMPEIKDNYKSYTIKIKKGIYFADDAAFCDSEGKNCKKREVTAHDFVYTLKRLYDPVNKSPAFSDWTELGIIGMAALRTPAEKPGGKFNYDTEVEGLRALDRYTLQIKVAETRPRLMYRIADGSVAGVVAREVVEKYGDKIMQHPVGTGAFKLDQWTRGTKITFVRNPNFREMYYDPKPAPDDKEAQAIYEQMKGKRLPMVDRVEVSIIDQEQPRWLAFLGYDHDFYERLAPTYAYEAIPGNHLAPNLVKRGIKMKRTASPDMTLFYFNMEDPMVGGYTPDKIALRRAIGLAYNTDEEIRIPRRNQATMAQSMVQPAVYGYDPLLKTEMSEYNLPKAMALLDMYGYTDKDGDGWRDMPDGSQLQLDYFTMDEALYRELAETMRKSMTALGVKIKFTMRKFPDNLKAARAGKMQMWTLAYSASDPDADGGFAILYGPSKGLQNLPRFDLPAYNDLYLQQQSLPDGPERLAVMRKAVKLAVAYMPIKFTAHRVMTDMSYPWFLGYRRPVVGRDFWKYIDIDTDILAKYSKQ